MVLTTWQRVPFLSRITWGLCQERFYLGKDILEVLIRIAGERGFFDLLDLFVHVVGEALEGWKMRSIVPPDEGLIGKELVRVKKLLFGSDDPDLQPVSWPEELTADSIHCASRRFVSNQDLPGGHERRSG